MDQDTKTNQSEAQDTKSEETPKGKNTGMAVIAYILFFIPLLTESKNDPFVKYHVKQGLALFVVFIASMIISVIPFLGYIVSLLINAGALVLFFLGVINAVNGKQEPLPIIGEFAEKLQF